ncbi:MAG: glucuronate isomerase [Oscillospiraceae bacterium]|nr:glucuronate isomerase [Oscillospiraceae bacterium]
MKQFMSRDFLLDSPIAQTLFSAAESMPVFDWHCHLSPKEIYENKQPENIAELWLTGDHYKWRAMRSFGIDEKYITGDADGYEKFMAWAKVMPYLIGNPLYHWTHLELRRYFDIDETLCERTADQIWKRANAKIAEGGFRPRELIVGSNVRCLFTTDDPADSLEYHRLIAQDRSFTCKVLPAFRPDKALNVELPSFLPWLAQFEKTVGEKIKSFAGLKAALKDRISFFDQMGCRASDQAFSYMPFAPADDIELELIFSKVLFKSPLTELEADKYRTSVMLFLASKYAEKGWAMEIHMGAMRNNNTRMLNKLGPDSGFDSIGDDQIALRLSRFLDSLAAEKQLPKTILFTLNPKDNYVLGSMLGNFQSPETAGKIQFGSAWWFNDNIDGMREQMKALANLGCIGKFIGMVTDSRSFLSYPRHEYFRRILCGLLGGWVEDGLYPDDFETLEKIVRDISYNNAVDYFKPKV